jgi:phosphatidylserine decarboxylase
MSTAPSVWLQYLLPQRLLSRFIYHVARCEWSWFKNALISWFAGHYRVDWDEAQGSSPQDFVSFNAFFTRSLRPGVRPLEGDPALSVVAPVDGRVSQSGRLQADLLLQAKGMYYSLRDLLGAEEQDPVDPLLDGDFATFYLAPHNYHRIHMPVAGELRDTLYIPGRRFSVAPHTVAGIPRLFCRNERVVCWFDCAFGAMALVLVGALNVSSIATTWLGEIPSGAPRRWSAPAPGTRFARGMEIGHFNLGSTVIALFPRAALTLDPALRPGQAVRLGQQIARLTH